MMIKNNYFCILLKMISPRFNKIFCSKTIDNSKTCDNRLVPRVEELDEGLKADEGGTVDLYGDDSLLLPTEECLLEDRGHEGEKKFV